MRVALKFAYDGTPFAGFARQPGRRTVEGDLLSLLSDWDVIQTLEQARYRSGSRTDRGVSALGNVVAFSTEKTLEELFNKMPGSAPALYLYGIQAVEEGFYPRFADQRWYRYYLRTTGLEIDPLLQVLPLFRGEHDFRNFAKLEPGKDPMRCIQSLDVAEQGRFLVLDFRAQTFLWHQVRRVVAALIRVGQGKLTKDDIQRALTVPEQRVDFGLAPAEPLLLKEVSYPIQFRELPEAKSILPELEERFMSRL